MKSRILTFLSFSLLFSFSALAQVATPEVSTQNDDDDVVKISTTLIQIDAVVTDKKGNIVTDLTAKDFEIYENGKKQDITNFSFVTANPSVVPAENRPLEALKNKNAVPIPPTKLKPEQVRRTYALVVDDLGLSFPSIFFVKESLKKFINEQVRDGDLVAVIRTGGGIGALQSFTSDKRQLLANISKLKWNPQGRGGIGAFAPIDTTKQTTTNNSGENGNSKDYEAATEEFRNDNFSIGTLGALNYIIRGMDQLPGRKSLVLFSEGFQTYTKDRGMRAPTRIANALRFLADRANRSAVSIYTLDPRGLEAPGFASAEDNITDIFGSGSDSLSDRADAFFDSQQTLRYLAEETGGLAYINQNNIGSGLRKAVNDQSDYYLLGYQPDEAVFDPKKAKYNNLELKLTRPGLKIRYRSGFFGIADEKIKSLPRTPQQKLLYALTSPFGASEIKLNLYPVFQNEAKAGDSVKALVYIDTKNLNFNKEANGNWKANFDLVAMTFGDNGIQISEHAQNFSIEANDKNHQTMIDKGLVYSVDVPIKKSGAYQFRVAVMDTKTNKVGAVSQFIDVPNTKKRLALSNLLVDNFTAAEWQKANAGTLETSERGVLFDTTLRQFKPNTILRYDYVVYKPKLNTQVETQARLIKDDKVIYEETPAILKAEGQTDLNRLQTAGAITLGKNLEPGTYLLQIIASNPEEPKKFATQYVEFEIVN
jgi:VWFA-related protein